MVACPTSTLLAALGSANASGLHSWLSATCTDATGLPAFEDVQFFCSAAELFPLWQAVIIAHGVLPCAGAA